MGSRRHAANQKPEFRIITNPDEATLKYLEEINFNAFEHNPWSYDIIKSCFDDHTYCVGMYLKNELIGYSFISVIMDEAELYTICVLRRYQGLGFGHSLLLKTLQVAKEHNAQRCFLEVRESNAPALYLYDVYGFTITGVRKKYYPATANNPAEDAYTMSCELDNLPE